MDSQAIFTEDLTCDFGTVRAVDSLCLEVPVGSVFGFLGRNGAGKTTTMRLLLGLLEPSRGWAKVMGFDTRTHGGEIRGRIGALLEYPGLYERLNAEDNLEFYGRVWHLPFPELRARIKELLLHFGLWERRREPVGKWSRGMKHKLAVARALLHRPSLVFLDEPTTGLDPVAAAALRKDLSSLVENEGVTVFLNTHNLAEAENLCQLVGVIDRGRLLAVGRTDELGARCGRLQAEIIGCGFGDGLLASLRARPEVFEATVKDGRLTLELSEEARLAPLVRLVVAGGAEVEEVRKSKPSLEEVFLTLVEGARCSAI